MEKFPCIFPVKQGKLVETSSHKTAPTTNFFLPLTISLAISYKDGIGAFVEARADQTIGDGAGVTPVEIARARDYTEIIGTLSGNN